MPDEESRHTISVLVGTLAVLVATVVFTKEPLTLSAGLVKGIAMAASVFVAIGAIFFPFSSDEPFKRPHPVFWRIVLSVAILYLLGLTALMFLPLDMARQLLTYIDSSLGRELPEKSYAEDCRFMWSVIYPQLDVFVVAHLVGWWVRALILRDEWICWILSVAFEFAEYSLEHQLPNFAECWWDHWLLDVAICNWLGIYLGMRCCRWFEVPRYEWRLLPSVLTPESWTNFDWATTRTFRGYLVSLMVIAFFLVADLNCFYLKYLLWVPPAHPLNGLRLLLLALIAAPAVRQTYRYFNLPDYSKAADKPPKRLGEYAWTGMAIVCLEALICLRFGRGQFPAPWPTWVKVSWSVGALAIVLFPVFKFHVKRPVAYERIKRMETTRRISPRRTET